MFAQIALPVPRRSLFTYAVPEDLRPGCRPGCLVLVPVGRTRRVGVVWSVGEYPHWEGDIRPLAELLGNEPLLDPSLLHLLDWIARYYLQPIGSVVAVALPGHLGFDRKRRVVWRQGDPGSLPPRLRPLAEAVRVRARGLTEETLARRFGRQGLEEGLRNLARQGMVSLEEVWRPRHQEETEAIPDGETLPTVLPGPELNSQQAQCTAALEEALEQGAFASFLLEGVTGSGKTEVYFRAVERCLAGGRQALLLVPEIALTPQLTRRYRARFSQGLAIFHSGLGDRRRFDYWQEIRRGEARVVIGARSAIFAPFHRLGLVVVDEEHDGSYKQEGGVPYNARDMAVVRARQAGAVLVLGSATPSLESQVNVERGRYRLLRLTGRATGAELPRVTLVDLKAPEVRDAMGPGRLLSPLLRQAMVEELAAQRQVLLFLNRRGYAPSLLCRRCGAVITCRNCSVALTLHKSRARLVCHYCDHQRPVEEVCANCGQLSLFHFGFGTEQLEEETRSLFPDVAVARLDRDTAGGKGPGLEEILGSFRDGRVRILVGTQMVAKGHHFPNLSLVGVVLAETSLWQPDFRSAERTFQLVTQVAGRAGREGIPGRVLVQTYDPAHYALQAAANHDVAAFARTERAFRQEAGYPPFQRVALLRFSTPRLEEGELLAGRLRAQLPREAGVRFLGPAPAPLHKLRGRFRWQVLAKEAIPGTLHGALTRLAALADQLIAGRGLRLELDVDPYSFL
ncbi:MAG: primosomal protein N' [Magnetococcales bacterium]|nr:primosomal protein N' [Magnetococcales bacterium]